MLVSLCMKNVSRLENYRKRPHNPSGRNHLHPNNEMARKTKSGGIVDIPFPRSVRDALLAEGLAEEHRWVPNSGWTTFQIQSEEALSHALWLMRLSYLRYTPKSATDPQKLFEQESEQLHLSSQLKALLEPFVHRTTNGVSAKPLSV